MAAPFLPVLSGLCPRLVSSAEGWDEDCRFVEMLGHTGSLPSLTTLKGNLSITFAHQEKGCGRNQPQGICVQTRLARGSRRRKGLFVAQVHTGYSGEVLPARVEAIGCHLAAFDLVSAPTIGVGVQVAWGGSTLQRLGLWQLLPQMGTDICSGIRLALDSLVVGSGKQS